MERLERFVVVLQRERGTRLVLISDAEPMLTGPSGERRVPGRVGHAELTALAEEIVPASLLSDLVMMEPVAFDITLSAGELAVRVVPGPSLWRVTLTVKGDGLAPAPAPALKEAEPASEEADEPRGEASQDLPPALDERAEASRTWSEIDEILAGDASPPGGAPPPGDASPPGDAPPPGDASPPGKPSRRQSRPSLEGALLPSRQTGEVEVLVASETHGQAGQSQASAKGNSVQLSVEELSSVAADMASAPPAADKGSSERPASQSIEPIEPIEIDFREDDVPTIPIEGLDSLLDRAWQAGATNVLLREGRPPAMDLAGQVHPLQGARVEDGRLVNEILDLAVSPSQMDQLTIDGFCRLVYRPGGAGVPVRCTLVRDAGSVVAWLRRLGDEHLPIHASRWLPASVRNAMPDSGLVMVASPSGMGKSTTATALAAMCHQSISQAMVVAEPLERSLPGDPLGILQRSIPEDTPSVGRALGDAMRLEARLVLVDVSRPEAVATELLALAGQGRLVIATWTAPGSIAAAAALMDALPPGLDAVERTRRGRVLRCVVGVNLVPARPKGVLPIFEVLQVNPMLLSAICQGQIGPHGVGTGEELMAITFEASLSSLRSRGLVQG